METSKNIVIFDLDGTLANIGHRLHHIDPGTRAIDDKILRTTDPLRDMNPCLKTPDWSAFYAGCVDDEPVLDIIEILFALHSTDHEIWVVSGRSDVVKEETLTWLRRHAVVPDKLIMRPANDHTPDEELKERWLKDGTIPKDEVAYVFEDRQRVVDMYRRNGLRVLQVCDGKY